MIEGVVEAVVSLVAAVIEAIAGVFIAGAEALSAWEVLLIGVVALIELVFWLLLAVVELLRALIGWRKPRKVSRPIMWRPKKLKRAQREAPSDSSGVSDGQASSKSQ